MKKKTKFIAFYISSSNKCNEEKLTIHTAKCLENDTNDCSCSQNVNIAGNVKYLGIVLDESLRWKAHIEYLNARIRKYIYLFYQLRECLNTAVLKTVYRALVESVLQYGIIVWGGLYTNALNMLNITQNTILKIIYKKNKRYSTNQLYLDSKTLNIRLLYVRSCILFVHKQKTKFHQISHAHYTRNNSYKNIIAQKVTKSQCQRFINFYGPKFYNMLSPNIRNITKITHFIKTVNDILLKNPNLFCIF